MSQIDAIQTELRHARKRGYLIDICKILGRLGDAYAEGGDHDEALQTHKKMFEAANTAGVVPFQALSHFKIGKD